MANLSLFGGFSSIVSGKMSLWLFTNAQQKLAQALELSIILWGLGACIMIKINTL